MELPFIELDPIREGKILDIKDEPISKLGDVYELDNHRLICGDSTVQETYNILMHGVIADVVITDPPYGINIVKNNNIIGGPCIAESKMYRKIIGDKDTSTSKKCYELIKHIKKQIIFGGNYFTDFLPSSAGWIIWNKRNGKNYFQPFEMLWTNQKRCNYYEILWNGLFREGDRKTELKSRIHPTQKPVKLFEYIIRDYDIEENQIILDPFLGSGSTLIACEKTNRVCYGIELDPGYIDVIVQRYIYYKLELGVEPIIRRNGTLISNNLFQ